MGCDAAGDQASQNLWEWLNRRYFTPRPFVPADQLRGLLCMAVELSMFAHGTKDLLTIMGSASLMHARFLGGASVVGSLGMVLTAGGRTLLFDYGLTPAKPPLYPQPAPSIDALFLTHAHIDHSGMVPKAVSDSRRDAFSTQMTSEVARLLMSDTLKIAKSEGYPEPYNADDLHWTKGSFVDLEFDGQVEQGPLTVTAHSAGHIPGASMYAIDDCNFKIINWSVEKATPTV
jgi:predicted metal-dependent RNase